MKLYTCQQGTEEWAALRIGIPTASRFACIMATPRKKGERWSAGAKTYLYQLCTEWLLGMKLDGQGSTAFMARGTGLEREARNWFAFDRNVDVQQVGFATLDDGSAGASADGLVGDDGLAEFKCLSVVEHVAALLEPPDLSEHRAQIQGGLWIYERTWANRVYYHPTLPSQTVSIGRDDEYIGELAGRVCAFCAELEAAKQRLLDMGCTPHVPQPRQPMPPWNPEWTADGIDTFIKESVRQTEAVAAAMDAQAPPASYVFDAAEFEEKF